MTIQPTPNLSASMPKLGEKNVSISGWLTCPPSDSAPNSRSNSALSFVSRVREKPLNSVLPCAMPSEAITSVSPMRRLECMIFSSVPGVHLWSPGASFKRISISTLAPSVFL